MATSGWRRPYPGGWYRTYLAALIVFGCILCAAFLGAGVALLAVSLVGIGLVVSGVAIVFGGMWLGITVRLFRFGIYVGNVGLRYRGLLRTRHIAWTEVKGVRLAPLRVKILPVTLVGAITIYIDRKVEEPIQTWVHNWGADFLGRGRAFESAFEALEREVEAHLTVTR